MTYGLDPAHWGLLILIGCAAGFLAGLGIGGAFVVIPALMAILPQLGIAAADAPKIAAATSLALIIPNSIASAQAYHQKASIDWRLTILLTPGIVVGAIAAATFANSIDAHIIAVLFVFVAIRSALRLLIANGRQTLHKYAAKMNVIDMTLKTVIGGFVSALLGLGVAFFCMPILSRFVTLPKAMARHPYWFCLWRLPALPRIFLQIKLQPAVRHVRAISFYQPSPPLE